MKNKKIVNHIKRWNEWRKRNTNSKLWKFMVLIGLVASPTFEVHKAYKDWSGISTAIETEK